MIGIYKFQNQINNHIYIGQSINIEKRYKDHMYAAYNPNASDYNSQFHQAIRKYGIENFSFEILEQVPEEEYSRELINFLECHYIELYDSYHNGYNATPGGGYTGEANIMRGEKNGRALLTEADVHYIRECYNAHIPFKNVYNEFKDKISKRGFQNIWWFKTWSYICPEYYTKENKYWHSHQAKANSSEVAAKNQRVFSVDEVLQARQNFYINHMSIQQIYQQYFSNKAKSTVYNMIMGKTYKDIPIITQ